MYRCGPVCRPAVTCNRLSVMLKEGVAVSEVVCRASQYHPSTHFTANPAVFWEGEITTKPYWSPVSECKYSRFMCLKHFGKLRRILITCKYVSNYRYNCVDKKLFYFLKFYLTHHRGQWENSLYDYHSVWSSSWLKRCLK